MKILLAHNRYLQRGGEDECLDAEVALLREHGDEVEVYLESNERVAALPGWRVAMRTVWSQESYVRTRRILADGKFDVMAVHNFFPLLSPSIYFAAKANRVPVIQTLHNYRLLCPNALFFRDGRVCQDCLGKLVPWPGVVHACYRGSYSATSAVAAMLTIHQVLRTWWTKVDVFIALTEFSRRKFIEGGLPSDKIVVKPNFLDPDPGVGTHRGNFALFVGRLAPEKGILTVLDAWRHLGGQVPLKVVGDGPLPQAVRDEAAGYGVQWLGRRGASDVYDQMGEASMLVVPSVVYENFPRVIVEAFAKGTPVIGADGGAIAELIEHGRTGLVFRAGDSEDLVSKVTWARGHPGEMAAMGVQGRREYQLKYTAKANYQILRGAYEVAMASAGRS